MWTALFRTIVALSLLPAPALADEKELLKGIQLIDYLVALQDTKNCKLNRDELNTNLRFVAEQSSRLKILPFADHMKKAVALYDAAHQADVAKQTTEAESKAAYQAAEQYNWSPALTFSGDVLAIGGDCIIEVDAKLEAATTASKLRANDAFVNYPYVTLWRDSYWVWGPSDGFSKRVSDICELLMKKLVNDWSAEQ